MRVRSRVVDIASCSVPAVGAWRAPLVPLERASPCASFWRPKLVYTTRVWGDSSILPSLARGKLGRVQSERMIVMTMLTTSRKWMILRWLAMAKNWQQLTSRQGLLKRKEGMRILCMTRRWWSVNEEEEEEEDDDLFYYSHQHLPRTIT